jgi:nucleotide-binding universal stress UspA family protein
MTTIKKILYPTDFSEHSQAAIPFSVDLAKHYGAELHCIHVVDTEHEFFMEAGYVIPLRTNPIDIEHLQTVAREQMEEFVNKHMSEVSSSVRIAVVLGKPFEQIVRYARKENVDLIVIGTHGHSALASMLLGSVAEKVIRKAPCPVLSVRHPEHVFKAP